MNERPNFQAMIAGLESQGVKKTEIAQRAGVSLSTIYRMKAGERFDHLTSTVRRMERISRAEKLSRVTRK